MTFDIKEAEKQAKLEVAKDQTDAAKGKIKSKLKQISDAEKVLANLRHEYDVLLTELGGV